jgi:hypothetical protein
LNHLQKPFKEIQPPSQAFQSNLTTLSCRILE